MVLCSVCISKFPGNTFFNIADLMSQCTMFLHIMHNVYICLFCRKIYKRVVYKSCDKREYVVLSASARYDVNKKRRIKTLWTKWRNSLCYTETMPTSKPVTIPDKLTFLMWSLLSMKAEPAAFIVFLHPSWERNGRNLLCIKWHYREAYQEISLGLWSTFLHNILKQRFES